VLAKNEHGEQDRENRLQTAMFSYIGISGGLYLSVRRGAEHDGYSRAALMTDRIKARVLFPDRLAISSVSRASYFIRMHRKLFAMFAQ